MTDSAFEVWLIDVSGSMEGKRFELLRAAVGAYQKSSPHVRLVAFATEVREVKSLEEIERCHGGTNLHLALDRAAELMCGKAVVFSDGEPSNEDACFASATKIPGIVDTIFCGDAEDKEAQRFLDKLARNNGGRFVWKDILKGESLLCGEVRELLGLPAPVALREEDNPHAPVPQAHRRRPPRGSPGGLPGADRGGAISQPACDHEQGRRGAVRPDTRGAGRDRRSPAHAGGDAPGVGGAAPGEAAEARPAEAEGRPAGRRGAMLAGASGILEHGDGQEDEGITDGGPMRIYLAYAEATILREIGDKRFTRKEVARTYRLAILAHHECGEPVDWPKVNAAITGRWSRSALLWIKNQAWSGKCFHEPSIQLEVQS